MVKKTVKMLIFCVFCLLPLNIKALCTNSDMAQLKELASNINVSYSYKIENATAVFDITLDNVFGELYLQDKSGNRYYYNQYNKGQLVFMNYRQGKSYQFDVYANGGDCYDRYLTTIYATTPTYNRFYTLNVCDNAKEYNLCQKWVTHNLTYNEFVDQVNNYIENRDKVNIEDKKEEIGFLSYVLSFVTMYYIPIIIGVLIIISIIKIVKVKKDSFGF